MKDERLHLADEVADALARLIRNRKKTKAKVLPTLRDHVRVWIMS
jgi:hypothetical protein